MTDRTVRQHLSRAELLREKRQQQPARVPVLPTKKEVQNPVKDQKVVHPLGRSGPQAAQQPQQQIKRAAVITSRTMPYSTPLRQSVSTPARRKMYHVNPNGVETRMPSLPSLRFSWQWVSGFMSIVFLTAVLLLLLLPEFKVTQVQIEGLERVAVEDVQNVILNNTDSIFLLDPQKIVNAVGVSFPELSNINMTVDMSGALFLTATERTPVLSWFPGDYYFWIDSEGVIMTPRGDGIPPMSIQSDCGMPLIKSVPVVTSAVDFVNQVLARQENPLTPEDSISILDPNILKSALELGAKKPDGASLVFDAVAGLGWQDSRGWKVYFGNDLSNFEFQQVEYQTIVNYLTEQGTTPTMINVEHVDAPVYKTK